MITAGQIILALPLASSAIQCIKAFTKMQINTSHEFIAKFTFAGILTAFAFLVYKFATSDFMYSLVFLNSNTAKPMLYKITGVWGNHEGSMLLFLLILTGYGFLFSKFSKFKFKNDALGFQGLISFLIIFYVFFTSNPFDPIAGLEGAPSEGMGLNPLLQDIGLAIHPPVLYLGFAGFSLAFSIAMAVLKNNYTEKNWCEYSRPWILISYIFLSLGVALGAWWAYRELGWGGFWFWDPVENTSLLPWIFSCALIHSMYCTKKFNRFAMMTIFLSLTTFMCSLLGFFLVRSGLLSSVHTFASDPLRGSVMLIIIFIIAAVAMISFGKKCATMRFKTEDQIHYISREAGILIQVVLLMAMAATIFLGIFYPIVLELFLKERIGIGEPYFNSVFVPITFGMMTVMIFVPILKWQRERIRTVLRKSIISFMLSACFVMYMEVAYKEVSNKIGVGLFLSAWIILLGVEVVLKKLITKDKLSKSFVAMIISHAAFGGLVMGITLNAAFSSDTQVVMKLKDKTEFEGLNIQAQTSVVNQSKNFISQQVSFDVNGKILKPENRIYFPDLTKTHEADIDYGFAKDVYVVMGQSEEVKKGEYVFPTRIYIKSFMFVIWFSVVCMAFGGFLALLPKKK